MHVLIIEDEPLVALDIQTFVEGLGARTSAIAETGDEALSLACEQRPDLITADFSLREGTGPEAVGRIQNAVGQVPVIYISGQPDQCRSCAADAVTIAKPILWLQLAQALSRHNLPPQ